MSGHNHLLSFPGRILYLCCIESIYNHLFSFHKENKVVLRVSMTSTLVFTKTCTNLGLLDISFIVCDNFLCVWSSPSTSVSLRGFDFLEYPCSVSENLELGRKFANLPCFCRLRCFFHKCTAGADPGFDQGGGGGPRS